VDTCPAPDLIDVGLRLDLGPLQVAVFGLQGGQRVPQLPVPLLEPGQLLVLGQGPPAVLEAAEVRVEGGQLEQPLLFFGRCLHGPQR
jgi:hypothetical protein